jgi:hypothetical protein
VRQRREPLCQLPGDLEPRLAAQSHEAAALPDRLEEQGQRDALAVDLDLAREPEPVTTVPDLDTQAAELDRPHHARRVADPLHRDVRAIHGSQSLDDLQRLGVLRDDEPELRFRVRAVEWQGRQDLTGEGLFSGGVAADEDPPAVPDDRESGRSFAGRMAGSPF